MSSNVPPTPWQPAVDPVRNAALPGFPNFTYREALLLCEAFNGVIFQQDWMYEYAKNPIFLWSVQDSIRLDGLDLKWGVDGEALCRRIEAISSTEVSSIFEGIRRFWMSGPEVSSA